MKDNKITLHPHRQSIEQKFSNDHRREVFLEVEGRQIKKIYRGEELIATEDTTLRTNEPTMINVTWKQNDVEQDSQSTMFIDGEGAHGKIKKSIHIYDGILDKNKMIICAQPKLGINYRNHRIKKGDTVAKAYSVLDIKLHNTDNEIDSQKWTKQRMLQELDFGNSFNSIAKTKSP